MGSTTRATRRKSPVGLRAAAQHLLIQSSFKTVRPCRMGMGRSGGARGVRGVRGADISTSTTAIAIAATAPTVSGRSGLSERGMATTACASWATWVDPLSMWACPGVCSSAGSPDEEEI